MNPVHVLVGDDARAEAMWTRAFGSAIDLYRFNTNVEAFGRLSSAAAPIDLVVLTPAQSGPFNLTSEQLLARVFEGPLAASGPLEHLHVIVVGERVQRVHPRVASVRTLDAAIRLVKFGEVEAWPTEASSAPVAAAPHAGAPVASRLSGITTEVHVSAGPATGLLAGGSISSGVISRIWDAVDRASHAHDTEPSVDRALESHAPVTGGGAARGQQVRVDMARGPKVPALAQGPAQLFSRATSTGFMVNPAPAAAPGAPGVQVGGMPGQVVGGGAQPLQQAAQVGAPGESIAVASGQLLPARQVQLEAPGYRGEATRGGVPQASSHHAMAGGQPVPPALASQVHSMIYAGATAAPNDPLLSWSGNNHGAVVATGVPVPQAPMPPLHAQPQAPRMAAPATPMAARQLSIDPPAGVYAPSPAAARDPFLARAESGGGDVSFG